MLLLLILAAAGPTVARAEWVASLVTVGPGDAIWERFGHNMIRVRDTDGPADVVYNWGVFDFDKPNFVGNFVQGRMLYTMQRWRTGETLEEYRQQNRHVYEQRLNFTQEQVIELLRRCEENARPENADYRYDYFKDNCSTRVRDMLDGVSGGALSKAMKGVPTNPPVTYRFQATRLMQEDFWASLGADFAIGPNGDKPLDEWADGFLPEAVMKAATAFSESPQEMWQSTRPQPPAGPPTRWPWLLGAGLLGFAAVVFSPRRFQAAFIVTWGLLSGIGGLFMLSMWVLTDHTATYANQNLWHYSPLGWVAVGLLLLRKRQAASRTATAILSLSVFGCFVWAFGQLFGGPIAQENGGFILMALPLNLATAWVLRRRHTTETDAQQLEGVTP